MHGLSAQPLRPHFIERCTVSVLALHSDDKLNSNAKLAALARQLVVLNHITAQVVTWAQGHVS